MNKLCWFLTILVLSEFYVNCQDVSVLNYNRMASLRSGLVSNVDQRYNIPKSNKECPKGESLTKNDECKRKLERSREH